MVPSCISTPTTHSFAVPWRVDNEGNAKGNTKEEEHLRFAKYLQPLKTLANAARHLMLVAYGGKSAILSTAIVEETLETSTVWWLVLTHSTPTKDFKMKSWLAKHLPPISGLDIDSLTTLTPWLQRRLGWGDARTTPDLLDALQREARLPALCLKDELVVYRHELAREELRLRQPSHAPSPQSCPALRTHLGHQACIAQQLMGDNEMVERIANVATAVELPRAPAHAMENNSGAPMALANGGTVDDKASMTAKSPDLDAMWDMVVQTSMAADNLHLRATCQLLRRIAYNRVPTFAKPLPDGRFSHYAFTEESDSEQSEEGIDLGTSHTVYVWGLDPFCVFASKRMENAEVLRWLKDELGSDVSFPRFLIKLLYTIRQTTPPCPLLDPKLLEQAKAIWGLHVGRKPQDALSAEDLDMLDNVLERPRVTRCLVCYKPVAEADSQPAKRRRIHDSCQQHTFECNSTRCGHKGDLPPPDLLKVPIVTPAPVGASEAHKAVVEFDKKRKANVESLNLATTMWIPRKCPECGERGHTDVCRKPECRPKSTKVAR